MKKKYMLIPVQMITLLYFIIFVFAIQISISASSSVNLSILSVQEREPDLKPFKILCGKSHCNLQKADAYTLPQQYVLHEPIVIENNVDFSTLGFPGDGSPENPYLIEGLNITSKAQILIHIHDTMAYFSIRNNLLNGLNSTGDGIYLSFVTHGTIDTNIVTNCKLGISLVGSENNTVSSNTVSNCESGIHLVGAWNTTLSHNTVSNNRETGIRLLGSGHNTLLDNSLVNNGLSIGGSQVEHYLQANVADNVINGRSLVYWQNVIGGTVPPHAGQVILINAMGVEVTGQDLSRASIGVLAAFSSHLYIHHNTAFNNSFSGIRLDASGDNTVSHNIVSNTSYCVNGIYHYGTGISLCTSGNNTVSHNTVSNCGAGISLFWSSGNNTVSHNTVSNNRVDGIRLHHSGNNTLSCNTISNTSWAGIYLSLSGNNTISYNTIEGGGIVLLLSGNNTLSHNTVSNTSFSGISLDVSEQNTLSHNTVFNTSSYGITLDHSSRNNTVEGNNFLGNNPGGSSQASDDGTNNVFTSNYWDDHDNTDLNGDGFADAPYAIEGTANNQDPSPLPVPVVIEFTTLSKVPEFEEFLILVVIPLFFWFRKQHYRIKNKNREK